MKVVGPLDTFLRDNGYQLDQNLQEKPEERLSLGAAFDTCYRKNLRCPR